MNKYGLIGNNISYSLSPKLHSLIAEKCGYELNYELIDISENEIDKYLKLLIKKEYLGFNVTIPYKEKIIKHLDLIKEKALKIGAVNTVYLNEDGFIVGDNTDYDGFLKLLETNKILKGVKKAYILGTGGAAKTAFHVLNDKKIEIVVVSRGKNEVKGFNKVISYDEFKGIKEVELLINCTPVGGILNKGIPVKKSQQTILKIVDLIYNPLKTELMSLSEKSFNGLLMLIYQALESQYIWQKAKKRVKEEEEIIVEEIKEALINELIR